MADEILIKITNKVSSMTQIVESCGIEMVNKFIQQQGKLFRCFKAYDTTSVNCKEPLGVRWHGQWWGI